MLTNLKETVNLLKRLNSSSLVHKKLPDDIFEKGHEKLQVFEGALKEYSNFLKLSQKKEFDNHSSRDLLATIHMELMSFVHYVDEVDELLSDVLKRIPSEKE